VRAGAIAMIVIKSAVLTPDGADVYTFASDANGVITASAPVDNGGANLRNVFWIKGAPAAVDASSCATWTNATSVRVQQGAALRIIRRSSYTRAVTVTKNIYYGATWIINLHVWDSRENPAGRAIGAFDMSDELWPDGEPAPLPWRLCARAVGSTLEFKIWRPNDEPEPAWGDRAHGGAAAVPAGWVQVGKTGLYAGHIPPDGSATFADVTTAALS
jgi:hypothetical protein